MRLLSLVSEFINGPVPETTKCRGNHFTFPTVRLDIYALTHTYVLCYHVSNIIYIWMQVHRNLKQNDRKSVIPSLE